MPSFNEISATQLLRLIGTPDAPMILDVRTDPDFDDAPCRLPGAIRHDWQNMAGVAADGPVVVYCQKGLKISQGAAAQLRSRGIAAEVLEGGHFAWRDAGLPMIDPPCSTARWVTRHRPKIDRVACPWLIWRFIDPAAQFLYVAPGQVEAVADRFDAEPFDIPRARFGHHGDRCSFDAVLDLMGLSHPPLARMAEIIRAADAGTPERVPQAEGLTAILLGLSRMHRDDLRQAKAAMGIFDGLYRWARDAQAEVHDG